MKREVIVALDFPGVVETMEFLNKLGDRRPFVKVGMELFYSAGFGIVEALKKKGHRVFLDLKLHDIPNTVEGAMIALAKMNVDMVTVHASGTVAMMQAAMRGLLQGSEEAKVKRPLLLAITQLTSTNQQRMENELLICKPMPVVVKSYACNAKKAGVDGVVCSPLEVQIVHQACGKDFLTVTPGIRFAGEDVGDQRRVMTPHEAFEIGSDYIVIGRSVTRNKNPLEAYLQTVKEFLE